MREEDVGRGGKRGRGGEGRDGKQRDGREWEESSGWKRAKRRKNMLLMFS